MRRFDLGHIGIIIIFNDGVILALDRQYDALVPDLAPKRVRDVVELHQLPLDGDELVVKRRRAGSEPDRRLVVTLLADVHHITPGEGDGGVDATGPDGAAKDTRHDIAEDMLLEVVWTVDLELALMINGNSQHNSKYLLNPFMPVEEVLAEAIDDVLGVLGDDDDLVLARGSFIVEDNISAGRDYPGHEVIDTVEENEAKKHVDFVIVELFDL